ncbi:MAG: B12-binding domain-containing radical SAM protein [Actinobacteria bacterium]|nr:B12-binding domain-containing radical SAM protein [Actinomycetota bacterium]MBU1944147.1 B12-binding domain-containing radical SAM protein [Actinomycetota bacterium]MBU2687466.1 B12-binding domain-containing radical SAM protein [Actinomycetota bacterium]
MKVTFVYPDFFQFADGGFMPEGRMYLGVAYLSAVLKEAGHRTSLVHLVAPPERDWFLARIEEEAPDLIGFSSTTHMFRHVARMAGWLSEGDSPPVACGGVHPTIAPEDAIWTPGIDIACRGEAEQTLLELCEAMEAGSDFSRIEGLWVRRGDRVVRNPVRALNTDLDSLPFPDRGMFDPGLFCEDQHPRGTLMASRGCPFNCSYCSNHAQKSAYPNPADYVRFRSPENVVAEIQRMLESDRRIEYIRFDDDILTVDRRWLARLSALYRERVGMPFICNSRVNFTDEETAGMLAEMGCTVVCMGIESGNEWLREKVLNRRMSNDRIAAAFAACRAAGMKTVSTNMFGLPLEDTSMVLDTIKLNARCRPDTIQISTFIPYPNTELYRLCLERDLLEGGEVDSIFAGRSPLKPAADGWEDEAVKRNFHTLAYTYGRLGESNRAMRSLGTRAIDSMVLSRRIPSRLRRPAFERLARWADGRWQPEWIKY